MNQNQTFYEFFTVVANNWQYALLLVTNITLENYYIIIVERPLLHYYRNIIIW